MPVDAKNIHHFGVNDHEIPNRLYLCIGNAHQVKETCKSLLRNYETDKYKLTCSVVTGI